MTLSFDALIIGTGQAGPSLAARLCAAGLKTAVFERKQFGGTCVNTGCMPTKTMVASAYAAHLARRAADFGVTLSGGVSVDMKQVKARKDAVSRASREGTESWLRSLPGCTVVTAHARFTSPRTVEADGVLYSAERIFINVGGRAALPPLPGLQGVPYLTNSSMMEVDFLPRHLLVIGGSYVALEFAQMFRRFGSEVTIVEMGPRLVRREDEDVSSAIRDILVGEGIEVRLNAQCISVARRGTDVAARLDCSDGAEGEAVGSHLLLAAGRRPNTDDLGLQNAGIDLDGRGYIVVDEKLRTSAAGVWALGDCNGRGAFTHTSYNDYEIVAANLLDSESRTVADRIPAYALYIDPPLGRAGMTEAEARKKGLRVQVGKRPMTRVSRAVEKGDTRGFMKVIVDADSKRILGAAILGTGGDEVIHEVLDIMYAGVPFSVLRRAMHIHPTVSELVPTMLGELTGP
jgi:pyruvate/2-oxoglutarate dehydrogenase complex dihydrolipoamide dehydrogenase (E3) component